MSMFKNGKKPLSSKEEVSVLGADDLFGNKLAIPPALKAELDAAGLVPRWVDANKLYANQGYHDKGWIPYKVKDSGILGSQGFKFGNDPDGTVRRGSLILAVKTQEQATQHRAHLKAKANLLKNVNKTQAEKLREAARSSGVNVSVSEGYEENE